MATLKEKRTCGQRCEDFGHFVWNSENKTLMGRSLVKWVYISLYYVAFYIVMTGLFSIAIYVMMSTMNPYAPTYQDRLKSPGVMVWPDVYNDDDLEIVYNKSDKTSWMKMTKILKDFLAPYNESAQIHNSFTCTKGKYNIQHKFGEHHTVSCAFTDEMLGNCSGITYPTFGYPDGSPCFIIKMNRIINFLPGDGVAPYVNCTLAEGSSSSFDGFEYFPANGTFDMSYFPYYGRKAQPSYTNPLVAVKLHNVKVDTKLKIECRVVAKDISCDNFHDPYEGKVVFGLKIIQ
ncbi:potassium-transporting ATPase subunit beta-like [Amia ocellicauda]|uniref:potassium-transporting ATPase subunit beta-like n=1 Tax=Amia ocellicauda TaxID=2972642 RepID=UPI003463A555|nr:ATP4B ATPase [Amia calva]